MIRSSRSRLVWSGLVIFFIWQSTGSPDRQYLAAEGVINRQKEGETDHKDRHKYKYIRTQIPGRNRRSESSNGRDVMQDWFYNGCKKRGDNIGIERKAFNWNQLFYCRGERQWSEMEGKKRSWHNSYYHIWMTVTQTGTYPWKEIRLGQAVTVALPDDIALEWTILMALRGWLPLDHDGLIGAATCDDCLRWGAWRLFGES